MYFKIPVSDFSKVAPGQIYMEGHGARINGLIINGLFSLGVGTLLVGGYNG